MRKLKGKLTYANVVASLALFLVLAGGSAFAAGQLGKNSVGSKQLKKNAVTAAKIKNNAVTAGKIKNGAVTGAKVNVGSLGTVPSATNATNAGTAANLSGHTPFFVRLGVGGVQTLATNGNVSLVATCTQEGAETIGRVLAQTTVNGAVSDGEDERNGSAANGFLNVTTPAAEREVLEEEETGGKTFVRSAANSNGGFVLGPEGKMLSISGEATAMGINYITPGCLFGGVIDAEG